MVYNRSIVHIYRFWVNLFPFFIRNIDITVHILPWVVFYIKNINHSNSNNMHGWLIHRLVGLLKPMLWKFDKCKILHTMISPSSFNRTNLYIGLYWLLGWQHTIDWQISKIQKYMWLSFWYTIFCCFWLSCVRYSSATYIWMLSDMSNKWLITHCNHILYWFFSTNTNMWFTIDQTGIGWQSEYTSWV